MAPTETPRTRWGHGASKCLSLLLTISAEPTVLFYYCTQICGNGQATRCRRSWGRRFFCVVSSDSDVEELLLELHAEKKQALALAARARSEGLPFSLEHVSPGQATQLFRFSKDDLEPLRRLLKLPEVMRSGNRTTWSSNVKFHQDRT